MSEEKVEMHPVQNNHNRCGPGKAPKSITMAAYEVYCEVFSPQPALVDLEGRGCRGGFSTSELIAFLYARSFPKKEWAARTDEAFKYMENL